MGLSMCSVKTHKPDLLLAPRLQPGDLVRLVSPASYPDQTHIDNYRETLKSWGLRCDVGDSVLGKHGYRSIGNQAMSHPDNSMATISHVMP
ncbi:MAG: hypothetical protein AB8B97_27185 [Granulosicoccus sp.]